MRKLTEAIDVVENLYELRQMGYVSEQNAQFTVKKIGDVLQVVLGDGTIVAENKMNAAGLYQALFDSIKKVGTGTPSIFVK